MSETRLTKNALIIPSIIFNDGTLSSNNGNLTWNGGELNGNSSNEVITYTTSGNYFDTSVGREEKKVYDIVSDPVITIDKVNKTIDISTKYIPDCTEWWADNHVYFETNNINIGSVIDNKVYDTDGNYVCFMDTKKIEKGGGGGYYWPSHEADGSRGLFCYTEYVRFDEPNEWNEAGEYIDDACITLTEFKSDLSSLVDGSMMFALRNYYSENNGGLTFDADLSNLQNGSSMFAATYISSFKTTSLENLEDGYEMFCDCIFDDGQTLNLEWTYKLPALKSGDRMFLGDYGLETFSGGSLENLGSGLCMFFGTLLSNINELNISKIGEESVGYSSLDGIFYGCCLTPQALANVYNGIKVTNINFIAIGLGHSNGDDKEAYDNEFKRILNTDKTPEELFEEKFNSTEIEWQYNGSREEIMAEAGINTYSLRRNQKSRDLFLVSRLNSNKPIYTKLEEVTNNKNYYNFVSEDGDKKFFLKIYDRVSKPENYNYFNNLEEAMEYYKIVPK